MGESQLGSHLERDVAPHRRFRVNERKGVDEKVICFFASVLVFDSEIFPSSVKGRAMAVATSLNWASNLLLSATFLSTMQVTACSLLQVKCQA